MKPPEIQIRQVVDTNPDLYVEIAENELRAGSVESALKNLDNAITFSQKNIHYLMEKVKVLNALNRWEDSKSLIEDIRPECLYYKYLPEYLKTIMHLRRYEQCIKLIDDKIELLYKLFEFNAVVACLKILNQCYAYQNKIRDINDIGVLKNYLKQKKIPWVLAEESLNGNTSIYNMEVKLDQLLKYHDYDRANEYCAIIVSYWNDLRLNHVDERGLMDKLLTSDSRMNTYISKLYNINLKRAEALTGLEDFNSALRCLSRASKMCPGDDCLINIKRAEIYEAANNLDAAGSCYDANIAAQPDIKQRYLDRASFLSRTLQYENEIYCYYDLIQRIQMKEGQSAEIYFKIGIAYDKLQQYNKAIKYFNKANSINPSLLPPYNPNRKTSFEKFKSRWF